MICQKTYYCLAAYWFCLPARLPVVLRTLWLSVGLLIHQPPRTIPPIAKNETYYTQDDNCSALKYSECGVAAEPFKIIPIITHFWQRHAVIRYIIEHSRLWWVDLYLWILSRPPFSTRRVSSCHPIKRETKFGNTRVWCGSGRLFFSVVRIFRTTTIIHHFSTSDTPIWLKRLFLVFLLSMRRYFVPHLWILQPLIYSSPPPPYWCHSYDWSLPL